MLKYNSTKQIDIFEFTHPFETELDKENRWVKLSKLIPWDQLVEIYSKSLSRTKGKKSIDGRLAIGSLIIKHKLQLSDREVVESLKENIYLQYFVGFRSFQKKAAFDASLLVHIRKRMGKKQFDLMNEEIIRVSEKISSKTQKSKKTKGNTNDNSNKPTPNKPEKEKKNKGKLKVDATVADQMIVHPTDHGLLNKAREESERLIDELYKQTDLEKKPRTYRRNARKDYLAISKKKRKTKKEIRKAIRKQLGYLNRNIKSIHKLLDLIGRKEFPLPIRDQRIFWIIQLLYEQQKEMYDNKTHSVKDRIVNIYQPYVRPIPRGKEKASVEFGAKLGVSEVDGFTRLANLSWDAYNESKDLKDQVKQYKQFHGYYPEVVLADNIYLTRENREFLKELGIRITGKPLGRPPKNESYYQKNKRRKEHRERSHIEGKFGQGKNAYGLKTIRAKRQDTSESWISAIFFVMNLVKLVKLSDIFYSFFKMLYFKFKITKSHKTIMHMA
ncbi:MAG TPA: IS5 family transposase [Bacteroidetes bacterium]|nr:IS5 family transposase [Bacteroidota bacterium]